MARNFVILNGINSLTIPGLAINELPPISKPKKRVEIEEIDGKDGDKIIELGYSAYDKQMTIGLFGSYDIDLIIDFFNSEGTVIFSNEEDKYYKYKIIEQIDFERLIKFRIATITFHIQPFKYSVQENRKNYLIDENKSRIDIRNSGNIYSRPILDIKGTGNISIYLNNELIFAIALGNLQEIIIDTCNMEAYLGTTLLNRIVAGDYDKFKLNIGKNTITWTGNINSIEISNFSRWL